MSSVTTANIASTQLLSTDLPLPFSSELNLYISDNATLFALGQVYKFYNYQEVLDYCGTNALETSIAKNFFNRYDGVIDQSPNQTPQIMFTRFSKIASSPNILSGINVLLEDIRTVLTVSNQHLVFTFNGALYPIVLTLTDAVTLSGLATAIQTKLRVAFATATALTAVYNPVNGTFQIDSQQTGLTHTVGFCTSYATTAGDDDNIFATAMKLVFSLGLNGATLSQGTDTGSSNYITQMNQLIDNDNSFTGYAFTTPLSEAEIALFGMWNDDLLDDLKNRFVLFAWDTGTSMFDKNDTTSKMAVLETLGYAKKVLTYIPYQNTAGYLLTEVRLATFPLFMQVAIDDTNGANVLGSIGGTINSYDCLGTNKVVVDITNKNFPLIDPVNVPADANGSTQSNYMNMLKNGYNAYVLYNDKVGRQSGNICGCSGNSLGTVGIFRQLFWFFNANWLRNNVDTTLINQMTTTTLRSLPNNLVGTALPATVIQDILSQGINNGMVVAGIDFLADPLSKAEIQELATRIGIPTEELANALQTKGYWYSMIPQDFARRYSGVDTGQYVVALSSIIKKVQLFANVAI